MTRGWPPRRIACAAVLGLLVAGCATPPPPPPVEGPRLSGRLAVNVPPFEGQAARSFSAQFELQGTGERGELQLSTPLGSTLARARWQPDGAEVMTPDGVSRYPDLAAMTRALVGEPLPMGALIEWLQGRPWAGASSVPTDAGFSQLGWSVRLPQGNGQPLLVAARQEPPQVQVRVRLDR